MKGDTNAMCGGVPAAGQLELNDAPHSFHKAEASVVKVIVLLSGRDVINRIRG